MNKKIEMTDLKERQKLAWQGMFYSIQRIDLLIVSISGAGIYVCLETIKYLTDKNLCVNPILRFAGGFFLLGIIVNFFSQLFSYKTNKEDYLYYDSQINECEESKINEHDENAEKFSKWTDRFNLISMVLMLVGLILVMTFFLFIF